MDPLLSAWQAAQPPPPASQEPFMPNEPVWRKHWEPDYRNLWQEIADWLNGTGPKPPPPTTIYRGAMQPTSYTRDAPAPEILDGYGAWWNRHLGRGFYQHASPWPEIAHQKGAMGIRPGMSYSAAGNSLAEYGEPIFRVYEHEAVPGQRYYRGGSLAESPLEPTSFGSYKGRTWDELLGELREALPEGYPGQVPNSFAKTDKLGGKLPWDISNRPPLPVSGKYLGAVGEHSVLDDIYNTSHPLTNFMNASFETDAMNRPGKYAMFDGPVPDSFTRFHPSPSFASVPVRSPMPPVKLEPWMQAAINTPVQAPPPSYERPLGLAGRDYMTEPVVHFGDIDDMATRFPVLSTRYSYPSYAAIAAAPDKMGTPDKMVVGKAIWGPAENGEPGQYPASVADYAHVDRDYRRRGLYSRMVDAMGTKGEVVPSSSLSNNSDAFWENRVGPKGTLAEHPPAWNNYWEGNRPIAPMAVREPSPSGVPFSGLRSSFLPAMALSLALSQPELYRPVRHALHEADKTYPGASTLGEVAMAGGPAGYLLGHALGATATGLSDATRWALDKLQVDAKLDAMQNKINNWWYGSGESGGPGGLGAAAPTTPAIPHWRPNQHEQYFQMAPNGGWKQVYPGDW